MSLSHLAFESHFAPFEPEVGSHTQKMQTEFCVGRHKMLLDILNTQRSETCMG